MGLRLGPSGPLGRTGPGFTFSGVRSGAGGERHERLDAEVDGGNAASHRRQGQTAVEYLGIIAVVVAIVLAITGTDIGQTILDKIKAKITEIT
ncbi:hypothetical protein LT493_33475 [Streptomyces tricolor]|nr:hypothetical protein [Streptomyces tricolor]